MEKGKIIGGKIKSIRESKKISLEELAENTGLSVEQLKVLEDSDVLPSLSPLYKVAKALGVRLGTFLDDDAALGPVVCHKGESSESISFSNGSVDARKHMTYFSLAKSKAGRSMDPFIIDIAAESSKNYEVSSHEGEEFIYVLSGKVEVEYGKEKYGLAEGDSIFYDSIVDHHVHAAETQDAKILAVVYSPC